MYMDNGYSRLLQVCNVAYNDHICLNHLYYTYISYMIIIQAYMIYRAQAQIGKSQLEQYVTNDIKINVIEQCMLHTLSVMARSYESKLYALETCRRDTIAIITNINIADSGLHLRGLRYTCRDSFWHYSEQAVLGCCSLWIHRSTVGYCQSRWGTASLA